MQRGTPLTACLFGPVTGWGEGGVRLGRRSRGTVTARDVPKGGREAACWWVKGGGVSVLLRTLSVRDTTAELAWNSSTGIPHFHGPLAS